MYIHIYIYRERYIHYTYYITICTYVYMYVYISLSIYIYIYYQAHGPAHGLQRRGRPASGALQRAPGPQLRFIHIHQLFRIQYT